MLLAFFQVRGQLADLGLGAFVLDNVHLVEHALHALALFAAKVALADLGPHQLARARIFEPFGSSLVRLDLWHNSSLPTKRLPPSCSGATAKKVKPSKVSRETVAC